MYQTLYRMTGTACIWYVRGERIELGVDMESMVRALSSATGARAQDIPASAEVMDLLADLVSEGHLILDV